MSYGPSQTHAYRRAGIYDDKLVLGRQLDR